jgi:hypothetical protein
MSLKLCSMGYYWGLLEQSSYLAYVKHLLSICFGGQNFRSKK